MTQAFLSETYERMLREQLPNLFRLHINPFVAQTCLCLERYVQTKWETPAPQQSFLANSFDEALSGAIKLARYDASLNGRSTRGLVIDPAGRLGPFAATTLANGAVLEFLPGLVVVGKDADEPPGPFGFVVLAATGDGAALERYRKLLRPRLPRPLWIACVDRPALAAVNRASVLRLRAPDIVVFDESFTERAVPFGAFTARRTLYDHWNQTGKTTFHSTTFQPNTISTLHFLRCLERDDPKFHAAIADDLHRLETDPQLRMAAFKRLYSPSLVKATRLARCTTPHVRASGNFVFIDGRRVFDGVSGVACSVRGHNPPDYAQEMAALADADDLPGAVAKQLQQRTGLAHVVPAVSGAAAVESALKLALVAQHPRRHVLALKAGFGGKTLFALTGTWNASYKENIGPLYADVSYVDPFAPDALAQIDAALQKHDVAVVQVELVQGVGGVRQVPAAVIQHLAEQRAAHGYLLLVDEIQTGMHRTGPFTMSGGLGVTPDLTVIGKGVSDMMFPFALALYSEGVQAKLTAAGSDLPAVLRQRHGYEHGYRTVLNVLQRAEELKLAERVAASGALFERTLRVELADCVAVRDIRVYGLLIGIELDASRWPQRWLQKKLFWFYLSAMLQHARSPVLVGFCQYEPNVLKITPALTVGAEDIAAACATIGEVLRRPFHRLLTAAVRDLLRRAPKFARVEKKKHEHRNDRTLEPAAR